MFSELPQLDGGDFEDIEESVLGLFLVDRSPSPTPSTSPDTSGSPLPIILNYPWNHRTFTYNINPKYMHTLSMMGREYL